MLPHHAKSPHASVAQRASDGSATRGAKALRSRVMASKARTMALTTSPTASRYWLASMAVHVMAVPGGASCMISSANHAAHWVTRLSARVAP